MPIQFPQLAAELKAKHSIDASDVARMREAAWPDGMIDSEEAEALFDLNSTVSTTDDFWVDFFVESLTVYIVDQANPKGYVSNARAEWLKARIDRDGFVETRSELELLVTILEQATHVPDALKSYTLEQIEHAVLTGIGPTRKGEAVQLGQINAVESMLLRRALFAVGGDSSAYVSQAEAEMLFRIKQAVRNGANAPDWPDLFVRAVGNHLMEHNHYRPLATDLAVRLDRFMEDTQPNLGRFFNRLASSGLSGFGMMFGAKQGLSVGDATTMQDRAILPDEREWLERKLAENPELDALESDLLAFIARESR